MIYFYIVLRGAEFYDSRIIQQKVGNSLIRHCQTKKLQNNTLSEIMKNNWDTKSDVLKLRKRVVDIFFFFFLIYRNQLIHLTAENNISEISDIKG